MPIKMAVHCLLDSEQTELNFEGLFHAPLKLEQLSGLLQWQQLPDNGWRIHSDKLIANSRDIKTRTRLLMDISGFIRAISLFGSADRF